ncbi:MAG: radical SAM protein [Desulfobacterales bacterium]|jgi:histone acetyltransferase (RNA polymerase elongator complex component)
MKSSEASKQNQKEPRPLIIPIFLPHAGCPHQCIFCDQHAITGIRKTNVTTRNLCSQIEAFLNNNSGQRRPVQVAFYGGNFLGINKEYIRSLLAEAARFVEDGVADSIRFSTRPDTIDPKRLDMIKDFPVSTIELGAQSLDDQVLAISRRGHTAMDTEKAVHLLKDHGYEIGIQIMVGLPGDNREKLLKTAQRVAQFKPDVVRIYPTVVLTGSPLAKWYHTGRYEPLTLEEGVTLVKHLYLLFKKKNIRVIRMGLQASEEFIDNSSILAGPYHPAFGHLVHSEIFLDHAISALESAEFHDKDILIRVHPKNISKMRGLKNENIRKLQVRFRVKSVDIIPDATIAADGLVLNNNKKLTGYQLSS